MHSFIELLMHVLWGESAKHFLFIDGLIIPMNGYIPTIDKMRCILFIWIISNPDYLDNQKISRFVSKYVEHGHFSFNHQCKCCDFHSINHYIYQGWISVINWKKPNQFSWRLGPIQYTAVLAGLAFHYKDGMVVILSRLCKEIIYW